MIDHMRAFKIAAGNAIWDGVETGSLNILNCAQANTTTGLVPISSSTPLARASCTEAPAMRTSPPGPSITIRAAFPGALRRWPSRTSA